MASHNTPSTTTTTTTPSTSDNVTIKYSRHLPHVSSLGPALLTLWSLLTTVPQFIGRVGWIRRLILSMPHISVEFSESDIDREAELPPSGIDEAQQRVTRIIAPRAVCGACGGFRGNFVPVNNEPTMSKYSLWGTCCRPSAVSSVLCIFLITTYRSKSFRLSPSLKFICTSSISTKRMMNSFLNISHTMT